MAYNWDYTKSWSIKVDDELYRIVYEGNLEKKKYYLTINDIREEFYIDKDLRYRKYDAKPYQYKFDIDGLDLRFHINEELVVLTV